MEVKAEERLGIRVLVLFCNSQVQQSYSAGTFRSGPLHQISLVGTVHEEVGGYFPDMLRMLSSCPFLDLVSSCSFAAEFG